MADQMPHPAEAEAEGEMIGIAADRDPGIDDVDLALDHALVLGIAVIVAIGAIGAEGIRPPGVAVVAPPNPTMAGRGPGVHPKIVLGPNRNHALSLSRVLGPRANDSFEVYRTFFWFLFSEIHSP